MHAIICGLRMDETPTPSMPAAARSALLLSHRGLLAARAAVLLISGGALLVFAVGVPGAVRRGLEMAPSPGLVLFLIGVDLLALACFATLGALLIWRRSGDWLALFVGLMLILTGVLYNDAALDSPVPVWLIAAILALAETTELGFLWLFPSGTFFPRLVGRLLGPIFCWRLIMWGMVYLPRYRALPGDVIALGAVPLHPLDVLIVISLFVHGAAAQIIRYRRVSTPVQRLQTRWLLLGVLLSVVIIGPQVLLVQGFGILQTAGGIHIAGLIGSRLLMLAAVLATPATIAVAILRYRLFEIDILINRTLVYTILTGLLLVIYMGSVVLLQLIIAFVAGEGYNDLATIGSTLAIAAVFSPLRLNVQRTIDRRFYRRKYDAARTIEAFGVTLRDEVDLEMLSARLLAVVDDTMQPAQLTLWLPEPRRTQQG